MANGQGGQMLGWRSRKQKICNTWWREVRTCPAAASQDCFLSSALSQPYFHLLVDFETHLSPTCCFNHSRSVITKAFIGQRSKDWLLTTLMLPCFVVCPFPPCLPATAFCSWRCSNLIPHLSFKSTLILQLAHTDDLDPGLVQYFVSSSVAGRHCF